jgi:hypothetical protein
MKRLDLFDVPVIKRATISPCGRYRYILERIWEETLPPLAMIGLNPSTADAFVDDRTVGRACAFAKREGAGGLLLGNLYAFRSTDPDALWTVDDPIGPENDVWLAQIAARSYPHPIVCAWGVNAKDAHVASVVDRLYKSGVRLVCLGRTKGGAPRHPLYVKGDRPLEPFP